MIVTGMQKASVTLFAGIPLPMGRHSLTHGLQHQRGYGKLHQSKNRSIIGPIGMAEKTTKKRSRKKKKILKESKGNEREKRKLKIRKEYTE